MKINLKRLLQKKDIYTVIKDFDPEVSIQDPGGKTLYGNNGANLPSYPVKLQEEIIGWVIGGKKPFAVASFLSHLAGAELEKKALARETLDKYKEIALLYDITEKLSVNIEPHKIAGLVINEANKLFKADNCSVMMVNEETGMLEILAASGTNFYPKSCIRAGEGIAGNILVSGKSEIINDVMADPRYKKGANNIRSLMCTPVKVKDRVMGVINISSEQPVNYTAGDLKLLSALAFQAALALENNKLNFIRQTFGRYLSDEVVNKLLANPAALKLGGEKKEITIMMSDLRGFTSLSESLSPETVIAMLNNYYSIMVEVIQKYHGTILEFIGDAIMVIFGAPLWTKSHAASAVICAVEMQSAMTKVNQWNATNGLPDIAMGIGINTGQVVVGNIGSEKRTKYGCVGSQVNLTARIESYTAGGQILVSGAVLSSIGPSLIVKDQRKVHPKGIKEPITVYDVGGIGEPYHLYL